MMKPIHFAIGIACGMALSAATVFCAYPDVSRRMYRDCKRVARRCKCNVEKMMP